MAYTPTTWVDDGTPVDQAHMNKIETELVALDARPAVPAVVDGQWVKGAGGVPVWSAITQADVSGLTAALAAKEAVANKAQPSGYASLDGGTKVPLAQIPDLSATYQARSEKAAASGYASLDSGGKVPVAQLPPVPSSVMVPIYDNTLVATGQWNNIPIPAGYQHLHVRVNARGTVDGDFLFLRMNGDGAANYAYERSFISGNTPGNPAENFGMSYINVGYVPGPSLAAQRVSAVAFDIEDYANTQFYKMVRAFQARADSDSAGGITIELRAGVWKSAAAINAISVAGGNAGLAAGSRLTIYALGVVNPNVPAGAYLPPTYGSAFPGSPIDGQEHILTDGTINPPYTWRFRYNAAATSHKWEFIGGMPLINEVATQEASTALSTEVNLATVGPQITIPRSGFYLTHWNATVTRDTSGHVYVRGNTNGDAGSIGSMSTNFSNNGWVTPYRQAVLSLTAGQILRMRYYSDTAGTMTWKDRSLSVIPIRCT